MALYNPSTDPDSYYDPYENTQQPATNIGAAVFNTAKTMAVFGALNVVGRMALGALGRKAAGFVGAYNRGKLGEVAKKTQSLGAVLKNTSAGKQFNEIYEASTRSFRLALSEKRRYVSMVAKTQGPTAARLAGFQRTFSDFKTFAGTVGSKWKRDVWAGAGVAYAIDSFFGFTKQMGLEEKPLWDIPGQIGNFGKWLAYDSVFTLGFQGAIKTAGVIGANLKGSVAKAFKGGMGRAISRAMGTPGMPTGFPGAAAIFKPEVLDIPRTNYGQHFLSKTIHNAITFSRTVSGATSAFNNMVQQMGTNLKKAMTQTVGTPDRFKKAVADPTASALRQVREIWKANREIRSQYNPVEHPGMVAIEFLDEMSSRAAMGGGAWTGHERSMKELTDHWIPMAKKLESKRTIVDDILPGLKHVRGRDVLNQQWITRVTGNLVDRGGYPEGQVKQLVDSVLDMKIGLHIYKPHGSNIKGGGVNLGFMDPLANLRRATSAFLNKPWHVPFTNINLSLGDIVGANIHLSDSPPIEFWKGNQHFDIGKRARTLGTDTSFMPNMRTTGDTAEVPWFTVYMDGKLGYIHDKGVNVIDWGRKLKFAAPNSTWRQYEHRAMNKAAASKDMFEGNRYKDRSGIRNPWIRKFLNWSQLEAPESVRWLYRKIELATGGKKRTWDLASQTFTSDNPDDWYRNSNILKALRLHAGQDTINVLKDPEAFRVIADVNHASNFGNSYDTLINSRTLRQRLADMEYFHLAEGKHWPSYLAKRGIQDEVNMIKAYPNLAEGHVALKKVGRFQEMNVYDRVRLEVIDDIFGEWWGGVTAGNGREHPLVNAIPELRRRGLINDKQAKSLGIFGKLSAFKDTGVFGDRFKPKVDPEFANAVKAGRRNMHDLNWELERDIIDFVQNENVRTPSFNKVSELIADGPAKMYNRSAYISVGDNPVDYLHQYTSTVFDNVTTMLNSTIFPFKKDPTKHMDLRGNLRYLLGNTARIAAGVFAFKALDAAIAANPLLDETTLSEGLGGFIADRVASARLGTSKFLDFLGVTGVAKHLNGLMPGFTTSAPGALMGAVVSRTLGGGPISMAKWFAGGAIANRMLAPFLPDFTKDYDQLEAEYHGKTMVPIMKSPTWLLGSTPWEGSKVVGYQPNWYVRTKSRWKETDTLYGSTFRRLLHEPIFPIGMSIGDFVDPEYMERKHYFSRPYPETAGWGREVPLIGPLIAGTFGRIMKPIKTMHQEFLQGDQGRLAEDTYPFANPPPLLHEGKRMMNHSPGIRKMGGRSSLFGTFQYSATKPWAHTAGEDFLYNVQNFAGIHGFLGGQISERLVNEPSVLPTLETAGRIASQSRAYFDANLGGLGAFCLPPDEKILTPSGLVNIEDILIGDFVYDNNFEKKKIINKAGRKTKNDERLFEITIGAGNTKIKTTEDHPFAIYKRIKCTDNKNRPCIPGYSQKCDGCSKRNNTVTWEWVAAKNIEKGDFTILPLPRSDEKQIIDLSNYTDKGITEKFIYFGSTEFGIAYELLENNSCSSRKELREYVSDSVAKEAIRSFRHNSTNIRRQDRFIEIDEDLAWFIGWWLAEGSSLDKNISFTLHIKEKDVAVSLGEIFKRKFNGSYSIYDYPEKNTCVLKITNKIFAEYLRSYGNVQSKSLKDLIYLPDKQAIKLCEGLINGDGWINHHIQNAGFTSVSEKLTRDLWLLLYRLGIQSTITINYLEVAKDSCYPQGTKRKDCVRNYLKLSKNGYKNLIRSFNTLKCNDKVSTGRCFTNNNTLFIQISNVEHYSSQNIDVYDVTVEDSHCFIGNYSLLHNSEPVRRLLIKPEYKRHGINPIPNLMPNWLPEEFLSGDPFSKIIRGELRLPGEAYASTHQDLRRTMPARSSMLGAPEEHMVQYFTGLLPPVLKEEYDILRTGTSMHEMIQDSLAAEGLLVQAERLVIDAKNDITGHVDAIIKDGQGGRGRRALEIKTINEVGFEKLDGPKWAHTSQLNFYLKQLGLRKGTVLYINRDNPAQVKSFDINYSQTRWEKDLNKLQRVRQVAADMMGQGIADSYGYSYSWLDRLDILGDVAPMSDEFKEAKRVVQEQMKFGLLTEKEISRYKTSLKHRQTRMRKYELYPMRFRGKVLSPDTQRNIQSINEDIKAGAEYSLPSRAIGAVWESFVNTNTFLTNKFFAFKDPLEHYKMLRLYGKEYKPWDEVWSSFAEPAARGMLAQTEPLGGAYKFGVTGFAIGGGIGGTVGALAGAAYGSAHGLFRLATNSAYIPKSVQDRRRIEEYFDAAKYERYSRMSQLSSGLTRKEYQSAANATLTAFNENGQGVANLFRGTPYMEKPYIESWLNTRNPREREQIIKYLPAQLRTALQNQWAAGDAQEQNTDYDTRTSAYLAAGAPRYSFDRSVLDPSVELDDIKLKTVEQAGYDAHDFGLGWNQQLMRLQGQYNDISAARIEAMSSDEINHPDLSPAHIKYTIVEQIRQAGLNGTANVYINNGADDINSLNITIRRDNSRAVIEALTNRQRYFSG